MKKLLILTLLLSTVVFNSFSQLKEFKLVGMIGGIDEETLYFYKDTREGIEFMDSVHTKNGEFQFYGKISQSLAVEMRFKKSKRYRFFISPSQMNLFVHADSLRFGKLLTGKISGSPAQDRYEDFQLKLKENNKKKLKIAEALELPEINSNPTKKKALLDEYKKLDQFKKTYFRQYASSPVIPYLIYSEYFTKKCDLDDIKEYLEVLTQANPTGMYVRNLQRRVDITHALNSNGMFPDFTGPCLNGSEYHLKKKNDSYTLFYIWRAWTPEKNKKYYAALKEIESALQNKDLTLVNIIRNSSYNQIREKGNLVGKTWRPKAQENSKWIEMESLDGSLDFIKYLSRGFHAYLLNKEGKIIYHQTQFDTSKLISEVSDHLSK